MDNLISKESITYQSQGIISELCAPLFKKLDLNYFQYFKPHKNGHFDLLYTDSKWVDYFLKSEFRTSAPIPGENSPVFGKAYISLWEGTLEDKIVQDASSLFGIANPISIVFPYQEHFECFAFGANSRNHINNYFNNIETLLSFCYEFESKVSGLISQMNRTKILLPEQRAPQEFELLNNLSTAPIIMKNIHGEDSIITSKELEIARHVYLGYSATEIADRIYRSNRTVETHINNLKLKLDCNKRSELISTLIQNRGLLMTSGKLP